MALSQNKNGVIWLWRPSTTKHLLFQMAQQTYNYSNWKTYCNVQISDLLRPMDH